MIAHGKPVGTWEDNIKMERRETGWEGVNCIDLSRDRSYWRILMNMIMKIWVKKTDGLLGYSAMQSHKNIPTFHRCIVPPSSGR
jgi:hypothetical protein